MHSSLSSLSTGTGTVLHHYSTMSTMKLLAGGARRLSTVVSQTAIQHPGIPVVDIPVFHAPNIYDQERYWTKIPAWREVSTDQFLSHKWQMGHTVQSEKALVAFLNTALPDAILPQRDMAPHLRITDIQTRDQFVSRVLEGIRKAPMSVRLSPHILSSINWQDPLNDPIRRQFIPLSSPLNVDHPKLGLDPLQETSLSPVPGLVHRYPERVLFLCKLALT